MKRKETVITVAMAMAALEAMKRKHRIHHPEGTFDKAKRFWLSEQCGEHCHGYRKPTRNWPWSGMHHGRAVNHVAGLFGVSDLKGLRRLMRLTKGILDGIAEHYPHLHPEEFYINYLCEHVPPHNTERLDASRIRRYRTMKRKGVA
jgi:hypothetical protein